MRRFIRLKFFRSDCDDLQHVRMPRTLESTIFEVVALFLVIAIWVVAILMYRHAPETIPTHFDLAGNPNNEGSRLTLLVLAGIGTLLTILLMACAYVPTTAVKRDIKLVNQRQYVLASRMVRCIALLTCLLFLCCILMIGFPTSYVRYLLFTFIGLVIVIPLVFVIFIKRAQKQ